MYELAIEYVEKLKNKEEFKRLIELKKIIDSKYSKLIISLKNKEAKYHEALEYPNYYDLSTIQSEFSIAKAELYSKPEVKEYFKLEGIINDLLSDDINDLKASISNKFLIDNRIKI